MLLKKLLQDLPKKEGPLNLVLTKRASQKALEGLKERMSEGVLYLSLYNDLGVPGVSGEGNFKYVLCFFFKFQAFFF